MYCSVLFTLLASYTLAWSQPYQVHIAPARNALPSQFTLVVCTRSANLVGEPLVSQNQGPSSRVARGIFNAATFRASVKAAGKCACSLSSICCLARPLWKIYTSLSLLVSRLGQASCWLTVRWKLLQRRQSLRITSGGPLLQEVRLLSASSSWAMTCLAACCC